MSVMKLIRLAVAAGFLWAGVTSAYAQVVTAKISRPIPMTTDSQPNHGANEHTGA